MAKARLFLRRDFRGTYTHEKVIPAGEYAVDAKELMGLGTWLLDNDYADPIGPAPEVETFSNPPAEEIPETRKGKVKTTK